MKTHIYTDSKEAIAIVQAAFPDYRHSSSRLTVEPLTYPVTPTSYWNGGSRDYWSFVRIADLKASSTLPEAGSGFVQDAKPIDKLPEGFALVRFTVGSYKSAALYLNPANLTPLLPAEISLTPDEEVVLSCTAGLKSFARREYAARKWGSYSVTPELLARWDRAVATLQAKSLLAKNGSVTTEGRNRAKAYHSLPSANPTIY